MPDNIRTAQYFKVYVADKPGAASGVLHALVEGGVNLLAFSGFPRARRGQLDFIPTDAVAFKSAANRAKLKISAPKTCFLAEGEDRVGAVADLLGPLADARINVTALDAVSTGGHYAAVFWVKPQDVKKAAKALGIAR